MFPHRIFAAVAVLSALLPAPASARDWGNVSGWYISSGSKSCGMYAQQRTGAVVDVVFLKRLDGSIVMQLKNPAWNIPFGSEARIQYSLDGRVYAGPVAASPMAGNSGRSLLAAFGSDFERELRGAGTLSLILDGRTLSQISLNGSADALLTVQSCIDDLNGKPPVGAGFAALAAKAPVPSNNPSGWVTIADYPSRAERERREGVVGFRLSVGQNGRADSCVITKSSGHVDLDAATCNAMMRRTKFTPALDANKNPVVGVYDSRVVWKLPG